MQIISTNARSVHSVKTVFEDYDIKPKKSSNYNNPNATSSLGKR